MSVQSVSSFNVTVVWGEITSGQNGIIQKYRVRLKNTHGHTIGGMCCVLVNETRIASFFTLHPGDRYWVEVCGYTIYHACGTARGTWFYAVALCKYTFHSKIASFHTTLCLSWKVLSCVCFFSTCKSTKIPSGRA